MTLPVIDLHCDLLCYLSRGERRTPYDLAARCAIPQLQRGSVQLQTLAIFTETTPDSIESGALQARLYQRLIQHCSQHVTSYSGSLNPLSISLLTAFENASGFCLEDEPLERGFRRLREFVHRIAKPLYVSLTWNGENRFGGGSLTPSVGLKEDGKWLLEELSQLHIAVDLSHASDPLAHGVLDYLHQRSLKLPILASHSNVRAKRAVPRNLPDEIAREIFRQKGVVGINLLRHFIGTSDRHLVEHVAHWLELGGEDHLVFGADFFYEADLPSVSQYGNETFFDGYQDASCYGRLLDLLREELHLDPTLLAKIAHQNAAAFISLSRGIELDQKRFASP